MASLDIPAVTDLSGAELDSLVSAAARVQECYRVLDKAGLNIVGEVLRGQGTFYEMEHYPQGDVFDRQTHSQYYYHAHRKDVAEHGHFHTFLRAGALPAGLAPVASLRHETPWPEGEQAIAHLIAVSMDAWGVPVGLFATNRWVTDETWYRAADLIPLLPRFQIDHAWPSWPVNIWLTELVSLYRFHIAALLRERDQVIEAHRGDSNVLENRDLEVLSSLPIDVDDWQRQLKEEQRRRDRKNRYR
ncbi:hypothetical protein QQM79_17865 [Marinobacteraceae bacterium S3BR75-40.1]